MRLKTIVKEVTLERKRKTPFVKDSPVAAVLGGPVQELSKSRESLIETDDESFAPNFDTTNSFVQFVLEKLDINQPIKVKLVGDRERHGLKTLAHMDPTQKECVVYSKDRNLADVLRSIAHEMVHASQFEKNKINGPVQDIGGPIEDEANAVAGQLVKEFGYKHPEIFE